ncbi:hypothetical protein J6590_064416, partial [Homalodisca vitripennis]
MWLALCVPHPPNSSHIHPSWRDVYLPPHSGREVFNKEQVKVGDEVRRSCEEGGFNFSDTYRSWRNVYLSPHSGHEVFNKEQIKVGDEVSRSCEEGGSISLTLTLAGAMFTLQIGRCTRTRPRDQNHNSLDAVTARARGPAVLPDVCCRSYRNSWTRDTQIMLNPRPTFREQQRPQMPVSLGETARKRPHKNP